MKKKIIAVCMIGALLLSGCEAIQRFNDNVLKPVTEFICKFTNPQKEAALKAVIFIDFILPALAPSQAEKILVAKQTFLNILDVGRIVCVTLQQLTAAIDAFDQAHAEAQLNIRVFGFAQTLEKPDLAPLRSLIK